IRTDAGRWRIDIEAARQPRSHEVLIGDRNPGRLPDLLIDPCAHAGSSRRTIAAVEQVLVGRWSNRARPKVGIRGLLAVELLSMDPIRPEELLVRAAG